VDTHVPTKTGARRGGWSFSRRSGDGTVVDVSARQVLSRVNGDFAARVCGIWGATAGFWRSALHLGCKRRPS